MAEVGFMNQVLWQDRWSPSPYSDAALTHGDFNWWNRHLFCNGGGGRVQMLLSNTPRRAAMRGIRTGII